MPGRFRNRFRSGRLVLGLLPAIALSQAPQTAPTGAQPGAPAGTPAAAQSGATPARPPGTPALHTSAQLVVVDVVVQDSTGQPVRNLPRDAFHVAEGKAPQTVTAFEEHSTANPAKAGPALPPMPPGTFTDYTPVPPGGALNVLLIDALNTPIPDQAYLRDQLKQYVNKAQPGTRVAIFGLNTRLYLLQGFTSDLETLKDAVNHKLIPRASNLMDDAQTGLPDTSMSDMASDLAAGGGPNSAGLAEVAANLQQFEAVEQSYQLQLRLQYTLDAFNALAHYLSNFPGRKNLLWFSGSFPIDILPDASLQDPFSVLQVNDEEFRDTTSLLGRSQVAVYPIDARGLMNPTALSASQSGSKFVRNPAAYGAAISKFNQSQADEHLTMEQMANDTGGRAYYNTNGLAAAAANALDSGSNYYTLAYSPTDRNPHGEFRSIHVDLTGPHAAGSVKLFYRHGYYADEPDRKARTASPTPAPKANGAPTVDPAVSEAAAYTRAAMFHGAPTPADLLFKVRVLPASTTPDTTLTSEDEPNPASPFKGPYRRYVIDYAALGSQIHLATQSNGSHTGAVEFKAYVYDNDGKLLNGTAKRVQLNLPTETYNRFVRSGLGMHMIVSAPARGESFLRIAVHDLSSNSYGVVEVPTSAVSRLPPPPPPPASPSGPPAAAEPSKTPAATPASPQAPSPPPQ